MNESQEPSVYRSADDEIDLFDLVEGIWAEKYLILAIFAACLVAAVVAIQFMTPVYKATAQILPPSENSIQDMNILNLFDENATRFTADSVFKIYLEQLNSRELKREVFGTLNAQLSIVAPGRNAQSRETGVSVSMPGLPPETVAIKLEEALGSAVKKAGQHIHNVITAEKGVRLQKLDDQIMVLRQSAMNRQMDRIAQLDESIRLARKLDIAEPIHVGPIMEVQGVLNQGLPFYYLGFKLLEAMKEVILNREDNDPFIEGLRDLQEQHLQLSATTIDADQFQVVRVEQPATAPASPEKPKPKLMISLAAVMGLMVGVFVGLVRRAIINRRKLVGNEASV